MPSEKILGAFLTWKSGLIVQIYFNCFVFICHWLSRLHTTVNAALMLGTVLTNTNLLSLRKAIYGGTLISAAQVCTYRQGEAHVTAWCMQSSILNAVWWRHLCHKSGLHALSNVLVVSALGFVVSSGCMGWWRLGQLDDVQTCCYHCMAPFSWGVHVALKWTAAGPVTSWWLGVRAVLFVDPPGAEHQSQCVLVWMYTQKL